MSWNPEWNNGFLILTFCFSVLGTTCLPKMPEQSKSLNK